MRDHRDQAISGASAAARDAYELALRSFLSWRSDTESHLDRALLESPGFTMAQVLRAHLSLCSRDVVRVRQARAVLQSAANVRANARERLHLAAIGAVLADDFDRFGVLLERILRQYPRDLLALHAAHSLDYLIGDPERMAARVPSVLRAWSRDVPGYSSVLAMHAFSLAESERHRDAADTGRQALELDPGDARAHHAVTHVFEMRDDAEGGVRFMRERAAFWSETSVAATHCWWHTALFHLRQGDVNGSLEIYDRKLRVRRSCDLADLIDASSLLWRIELHGEQAESRWLELARGWSAHIGDGYCSFNDVHAMLAFVGAADQANASRLQAELTRRASLGTRYGETTRLIGLPACRAIVAFGERDYASAAALLEGILASTRRIGGSHAQRSVLYATLQGATRRTDTRRCRVAMA